MDEQTTKQEMIARLNQVPAEFFNAYAIDLNHMNFQMHFDSDLVRKYRNGQVITLNGSGYAEFPVTFGDVKINVIMT